MSLEFYFKPDDSEYILRFDPLPPGKKRAISGFIGYVPLSHCQEDDSGGSVCFVEEGYMAVEDGNATLPDDWRTEENNYNEIEENGQHIEKLAHQEWGEGELLVLHRRTV